MVRMAPRVAFLLPLLALLLCSATQVAAQQAVAVFPFEIVDGTLESGVSDPQAHRQRLDAVTRRLRTRLQDSGRYRVVDIAPVVEEARSHNLQNCGGCASDMAARVGADLAVTGLVHKVSNLILSMTITVHDAKTGAPVARAVADFRGDNDESWTRALDWLVRNRLLAPGGRP
jgi:hypothetical protein